MNSSNLIRMANQIGTFFESQPDRDEALEGLAQHLQRFWEPRMRQEFERILAAGGDGGHEVLSIVREACARHGLALS